MHNCDIFVTFVTSTDKPVVARLACALAAFTPGSNGARMEHVNGVSRRRDIITRHELRLAPDGGSSVRSTRGLVARRR